MENEKTIGSGVEPTENSEGIIATEKKIGKDEELNPRQIEFIRFYTDPTSKTFANALQSALRAGYSQEYAESITVKGLNWLAESVGRKKRLLSKAERNLEGILDLGVEDKETIKVVADTSKFVAETVGKEEGYSKRTELTGREGKDLIPTPLLENVRHNESTEEITETI